MQHNNLNNKMEDDTFYYTLDTDLDLSFTSTTSFRTSSARSSLARSSLTLSFNDRISTTATPSSYCNHQDHSHPRPHRRHDPHWSAIRAARNLSHDNRLHLRHLKLLRLLGAGDLGRVFLCRIRDYHHEESHFALKVVDKDAISSKKLGHLQTEAEILSTLDHPFLPTLYAHIEVSHYTCMLIDYCSGGDLHSLLRKQPNYRLPVQAVKFYAAEVLVALEYLHSLGIVYRDLKPENILLREDGHIMLSDFDLCFTSHVEPRIEKSGTNRSTVDKSKRRRRNRKAENEVGDFVAEPTGAFSKSCVGTHEYLAPELVSGTGHGNGVDWWAFGVLIYELLYGVTPFKGVNKEATLKNIASSKDAMFCRVEGEEGDKEMNEVKDLIGKLLVKDPQRRMGSTMGATEIKQHPFFNGVKWALIRSYRPPEIRGGVVRKGKSHVSGVHRRRKWWWKGLSCFMAKSKKGSKISHCYSNASSSSNSSSSYVHNKIRRCP